MKRELLKRVRGLRGFSQVALATAARVTPSTVSKIECGRADPWQPEAERIAAALKWRGGVAELFRDDLKDDEITEVIRKHENAAKRGGSHGGGGTTAA